MFLTFLRESIRFSTIFLFGSTGEIITQKSGHLNLGTPGVMCIGAVGGCLGASWYLKSLSDLSQMNGFLVVFLPILTALLFGGLAGALYSFFAVTLRCNQNVIGLTITTFGVGLCKYVFESFDNTGFSDMSKDYFLKTFSCAHDNWFTEIFFSYGSLVYIAILIAIIATIVLKKTRVGLNLRSVGENPATADAAGINVTKYRYLSTIIGCAISGLGGLFYIMDSNGGSTGDIGVTVEGLGWLAVALVIFTVWKPNFAILGSILFSLLYKVPNYYSLIPEGSAIADNVVTALSYFMKLLPYIATIIVLVVTSMINRRETQPPAALGLSYFREER